MEETANNGERAAMRGNQWRRQLQQVLQWKQGHGGNTVSGPAQKPRAGEVAPAGKVAAQGPHRLDVVQ